ncbi:unnamed protein product [Sphenostylis stenocarpa]|uniref:Uncharacterized protein n=1 Tax=Sphenostylis stenocarpa TaxID=92480 RepID=A0AA86SKB1_9FABA|nr:unnamed protein product [Sphenostylis stenocarpa]
MLKHLEESKLTEVLLAMDKVSAKGVSVAEKEAVLVEVVVLEADVVVLERELVQVVELEVVSEVYTKEVVEWEAALVEVVEWEAVLVEPGAVLVASEAVLVVIKEEL